MSGKPTVTMTLAGDEKKLTDAFDKVGQASKRMGDSVDQASDDFKKAGRSADDWAEKSDDVDTKAMGFRDTITGLQDSFRGLTDSSLSFGDRLLTLGMGVGDLASGFTNFLIPAMSSLWAKITATTIAQRAATIATVVWTTVTNAASAAMRILNAVMRANPILFIISLIALLVGAFILLWNKSAGFRNFWKAAWAIIKNVAVAVGSAIGAAIRAIGNAVGWVIDRVKDAIGWFKELLGIAQNPALHQGSGFTNAINRVKRHHTGGVVPGIPGEERLAILQAGERVSTSSQGGGGTAVVFAGDTDSAFASAFQKLVRTGVIRVVAT